MTISRDDLDQGKVDFSDTATQSRLPPVQPAEVLQDEFLVPMDISVYRLAKALKVSRPRSNEIALGTRAVTTDTALRLGRYFGTTPEFWLALQTRYDLDIAAQIHARRPVRRVPYRGLGVREFAEARHHARHHRPLGDVDERPKRVGGRPASPGRPHWHSVGAPMGVILDRCLLH